MMDYLLYPIWTPDRDMDDADLRADFERMKLRNQAIDSCLSGELNPSDVLDILQAHSFSVEEYVQEVSEGVSILIAS